MNAENIGESTTISLERDYFRRGWIAALEHYHPLVAALDEWAKSAPLPERVSAALNSVEQLKAADQ